MSPHDNVAEAAGLLTPENKHTRSRQQRRGKCILRVNALLLAASIVVLCCAIWLRATQQDCFTQTSAYSPAKSVVEYRDERFQGAFLDENRYKGPPQPELDAAWHALINDSEFRVSVTEMRLLRKPLTQASWSDAAGGGFVSSLEVFHQLHCLNMIRQWSYKEYYMQLGDEMPELFRASNKTIRLHIDHCIDILRQTLQCHADVGVVTHSWVKTQAWPHPDFSSWHRCRNFEKISAWSKENGVEAAVSKTQDSVVLERPPCEHAAAGEVCP